MKLEKYIHTPFRKGISGLWYISGDFPTLDGTCKFTVEEADNTVTYHYETDLYRVKSVFTHHSQGVVTRQDSFQNISGRTLTLGAFFSRFFLEGNRYQVYTQYNGWHHESVGAWQDLVTQVTAADCGVRTCEGASPMMALCNNHNQNITVFHIMPNCQWQISARKLPHRGSSEAVVVEIGMKNDALLLPVVVDEEINLPTIFFFETKDKAGLGCHKLHSVYNQLYPRRQMPILYNTWFYHFDEIHVDDLLRQVDCAAELGVEMFLVDSGWYGAGKPWGTYVGDWEESLTRGFQGRLMEVSQRVREKGMIFGMWFEPERVGINSKVFKARPQHLFEHVFYDFANPEACDHLFGVISGMIDQYHIGFLKFDLNASTPDDPYSYAFYRYLKGYQAFISRLQQAYPHIYISCCAAGGQRTDLQHGSYFDSFWFTDNQGSYEGLTILKDTLKRMPGSLIERWNVQKYCDGFPIYGTDRWQGLMLTCNNSVFDYVLNVKEAYTLAFLSGGPIGFSGDIAAYPDDYKERLKAFIAQYKQDRSFYMRANAHILVDSEEITVIEYADNDFNRCVIQFFTKLPYTDRLRVYPAVDSCADYDLNGNQISGTELTEEGILFENLTYNDCQTVTLSRR